MNTQHSKYTRCPQCHTLYLLSLDQLTIAQGKVVCAECQHTFNAVQYLQHIEPDLPEYHKGESLNYFAPFINIPNDITEQHQEIINFFQTPIEPLHETLFHYLNQVDVTQSRQQSRPLYVRLYQSPTSWVKSSLSKTKFFSLVITVIGLAALTQNIILF